MKPAKKGFTTSLMFSFLRFDRIKTRLAMLLCYSVFLELGDPPTFSFTGARWGTCVSTEFHGAAWRSLSVPYNITF